MRTLRVAAVGLLVAGPVAAQSSQFGVRGLGLLQRPISVRATGTGGSFGLFDPESALNPASIGQVSFLNANFQTVQGWRRSESPAGAANARDNRYPGVFVAGPIGGTRLSMSVSASGLADRNFVLGSRDTLILRGVPVEAFDTLASQGGLSDLRVAVAWRQSRAVQWGVGLHLITGSNRIQSKREFTDSSYAGATERFTYSFLGFGASAGVMVRLGRAVTLGGMVRTDDRLRTERDSLSIGSIALPVTVSGGARVQLGDRLLLAGSALFRNWSVANSDLIDQGGTGSVNSTEISAGLEFLTDAKRAFNRPIRLGLRRGTLPFPLRPGDKTTETAASLGTSFRFLADRAGFDLALQRVWRKGGAGFEETATLLTFGITVRQP
jgi:hypothetical protein